MDAPEDRFDAVVVDRLTEALTVHLGPAACVLVTKAAKQAVDIRHLCTSVAGHVPQPDRERFLADIHDVLRLAEPAPLTPELLASVGRRLAEHIGPLARVLVEKESRKAVNPYDLYKRLATHIHDPAARKAFVAAAPR